ncbi:protein-disulfide reductase DsbD [Gallaecimonas xiamenensis]|uniref:Thiol:disulfide interchange protein DsbD n=1 Tax=Gallaecimonas xiamenensis 3-C-1 TaxID=745411 RepID=K2JXA7_9GAMM|nr:protein-disulfide reductase DsbD [Gallaecimonas xiamenensis]EKE69890.1 thiol:disulfide interchange protein precursor [Gallaecimonas xiamenensis 3-C-1]
MKKLLLSLLLLLPLAVQAGAIPLPKADQLLADQPQFLPVDQAFQFNFQQDGDQLLLEWTAADGYYLYKAKFKVDGKGLTLGELALPQGQDHYDEFFGQTQVFYGQVQLTLPLSDIQPGATVVVSYQGCADDGLCYPPTRKTVPVDPVVAEAPAATAPEQGFVSEQNQLAQMLAGSSLGLTLLAFFGAGVLIAFTPCVFPMYPILTGIIAGAGKQLTTRRAMWLSFIYVQGMAITYTALGLIVASAGAQVQAAFQHPAVLIGLSLLFLLLAVAMFGGLNLQLPSGLQERLNALSNQQKAGSVPGVLVMGVISGLVASPCTTAPLTGALLFVAQSGDLLLGALALYALSLGMGLPLMLIGSTGSQWLPRAGAWMETIKHLFGFILLAVPLLLLGRLVPDHWALLAWAAWLLVTFAFLAQANSSTQPGFWKGVRTLVAFLGLFAGAMLGYRTLFEQAPASAPVQQEAGHFKKVRNLAEMQAAITEAAASGKPVMVDFYADWCVACKEFEKYTFSDPGVKARFANMVLLQTDVTESTSEQVAMMDHFAILGLPTILFFGPDGQERQDLRVTGFQKPVQFLKTLDQVAPQ